MSAELLNLLFKFQPDEFTHKSYSEYNAAARQFAKELHNVSAQHYLKGADTPEDVLEVCIRHHQFPL